MAEALFRDDPPDPSVLPPPPLRDPIVLPPPPTRDPGATRYANIPTPTTQFKPAPPAPPAPPPAPTTLYQPYGGTTYPTIQPRQYANIPTPGTPQQIPLPQRPYDAIPTPQGGVPAWQRMTPQQLASNQYGPATTIVARTESGNRNIRELKLNPATGRVEPIGPASGVIQIEDPTWRKYAPQMGVDINKYPTAESTYPYLQIQTAVGSIIPLREWAPGTVKAVQAAFPWARGDMTLGQIDQIAGMAPQQQYIPAAQTPGLSNRPHTEWGRIPEGGYPEGPGNMPGLFDIPRVMQQGMAFLPLLSLFTRGGFQMAATGFASYVDGYQRGQLLKQKMAKDQWVNGLNETIAKMEQESIEYGDAFSAYANNEEALAQALGEIATKYNDHAMGVALAQGGTKGAYDLEQGRDRYFTDLNKTKLANQLEEEKLQEAQRKRQEQQDVDTAVSGLDQQYVQDYRASHGGQNPSAAELANAHQINIGRVEQERKPPKEKEATPEQQIDIAASEASTQQWAEDERAKGHEPTPNEIAVHKADELDKRRRAGGVGPKASDYKDYTWDDPEGKHHGPSSAALVPGQGLVDPQGKPIAAKPETIRSVTAATSSPAEGYPHEAGTSDYPERPNRPPPGTDITDGEWRQALTFVNTGKAPTFARDRQAMARFREIIPVAMRAMGVTEDQMDRRWVDYAAYKTRQQRIEAAFAGGQDGKTLLALNTVAHHIDLFRQYADAMRNGDKPAMNAIIDNIARQGGSAELMDFNIVSRVTGDELVRVLTGTGGGTITDREDIARQLSGYSSPEQFEGAANTLTNVLRGRFGPLQRAYSYDADPEREKEKQKFFQDHMMEPEARRMFQGEQQPIPGSGQTTTAAPAMPSWAKASGTGKNGEKWYQGQDGQWYGPGQKPPGVQ